MNAHDCLESMTEELFSMLLVQGADRVRESLEKLRKEYDTRWASHQNRRHDDVAPGKEEAALDLMASMLSAMTESLRLNS